MDNRAPERTTMTRKDFVTVVKGEVVRCAETGWRTYATNEIESCQGKKTYIGAAASMRKRGLLS